MAITIEGIPAQIPASAVSTVVDEALAMLNQHLVEENKRHTAEVLENYPDIAPDDIGLYEPVERERIVRLSINGDDEAVIREVSNVSNNPNGVWGSHWESRGAEWSFPVTTEDNIRWCNLLGIDPYAIRSLDIRGIYVKAEVFMTHLGYQKLRQDGDGYMKHTIDIPITEEKTRG